MAHSYTCREAGLECDFLVQSDDREELVAFVRRHAERAHGSELSDDAIEAAIVEIEF